MWAERFSLSQTNKFDKYLKLITAEKDVESEIWGRSTTLHAAARALAALMGFILHGYLSNCHLCQVSEKVLHRVGPDYGTSIIWKCSGLFIYQFPRKRLKCFEYDRCSAHWYLCSETGCILLDGTWESPRHRFCSESIFILKRMSLYGISTNVWHDEVAQKPGCKMRWGNSGISVFNR